MNIVFSKDKKVRFNDSIIGEWGKFEEAKTTYFFSPMFISFDNLLYAKTLKEVRNQTINVLETGGF